MLFIVNLGSQSFLVILPVVAYAGMFVDDRVSGAIILLIARIQVIGKFYVISISDRFLQLTIAARWRMLRSSMSFSPIFSGNGIPFSVVLRGS